MHFQSFHSDVPDIKGEWTIDDLALFDIPGPLEQVERTWTAVKKYSLMVDEIHDRAKGTQIQITIGERVFNGNIWADTRFDSRLAEMGLQPIQPAGVAAPKRGRKKGKSASNGELTEDDHKVLQYITDNPESGRDDFAKIEKKTKVKKYKINRAVTTLIDRGLVKNSVSKPGKAKYVAVGK